MIGRDGSRRPEVAGLRVLQVLATNDSEPDALAALELHRGLGGLGLEVRTLALGPGRTVGAASSVPVMSPSPRSLAAATQLRREQRWADVVVLRGALPAAAAGRLRGDGGPPVVVHLTDEARRWTHRRTPSRRSRLARRGPSVVVTAVGDRSAGAALGVAADDVAVIPYGVEVVAELSQERADARREAARSVLGIPPGARVVLVCGDGPSARELIAEVEGYGATALSDTALRAGGAAPRRVRFDGGQARSPDGGDPVGDVELRRAAADLVAEPDAGPWGPPIGLLRGAASGAALVADPVGAVADLLDEGTGFPTVEEALGADAAEVHRRGAGARRRAVDRFSLDGVALRWADVLGTACRRGMGASAVPEQP